MLKLIFNREQKAEVINAINSLNLETKWQIEIKKYRKNRSDAQNRLLWMWLDILGRELGYIDELGRGKGDMYDIAVDQCWPHGYEEITFKEKKIIKQRKTSKLDTKDFTVFLNNIDMLAIGLGIILPKPDDLYFEAMGVKR